jgi:hypothetical protein
LQKHEQVIHVGQTVTIGISTQPLKASTEKTFPHVVSEMVTLKAFYIAPEIHVVGEMTTLRALYVAPEIQVDLHKEFSPVWSELQRNATAKVGVQRMTRRPDSGQTRTTVPDTRFTQPRYIFGTVGPTSKQQVVATMAQIKAKEREQRLDRLVAQARRNATGRPLGDSATTTTELTVTTSSRPSDLKVTDKRSRSSTTAAATSLKVERDVPLALPLVSETSTSNKPNFEENDLGEQEDEGEYKL